MKRSSDDQRTKELFKEAIVELLEERREIVRDLLEEAIENVALVRAIDEGEKTRRTTRKRIFKLFAGEV